MVIGTIYEIEWRETRLLVTYINKMKKMDSSLNFGIKMMIKPRKASVFRNLFSIANIFVVRILIRPYSRTPLNSIYVVKHFYIALVTPQ